MPDLIHGNRELIRAINRSSVLNTIRIHGPISRKEITKYTSLSAATITGITAELIDEDLVFEKETGDSSGGRRPILLALNKQSRYMIGVKLSIDHITAALTDLEATVLNKRTVQLPSHDLQFTVEALGQVVADLIADQAVSKDKILGVGIGLAGIVDAEKGVLRHSPIYGWRNVPLVSLLQKLIDVPIFLDNDVNTFTLTEKWFGLGSGIDNFLIVTVGRGVGMGMVMNGSLYQGSRGGAGELGHTVIDPSGPLCVCGKHGCLEAYASDPAMLNMAAEAYQRGELPHPVKTVEDLLDLAEQGNPVVQKIFHKAGFVLGQGIANLINIFNPELIIFSGEGVRYGDHLFGPMRDALQQLAMPGLIDDTQIKIDAWDDDAWARGAAGIVLEKLFQFPLR
jgi:N-acetylglucosamine repressor